MRTEIIKVIRPSTGECRFLAYYYTIEKRWFRKKEVRHEVWNTNAGQILNYYFDTYQDAYDALVKELTPKQKDIFVKCGVHVWEELFSKMLDDIQHVVDAYGFDNVSLTTMPVNEAGQIKIEMIVENKGE